MCEKEEQKENSEELGFQKTSDEELSAVAGGVGADSYYSHGGTLGVRYDRNIPAGVRPLGVDHLDRLTLPNGSIATTGGGYQVHSSDVSAAARRNGRPPGAGYGAVGDPKIQLDR